MTKEGPRYDVTYSVVFDGPADPGEASNATYNGVTIPQIRHVYPTKVAGEATTYANEIDANSANDTSSVYRVSVRYTTTDPFAPDDGLGGGSIPAFVLPPNRIQYGTAAVSEDRDHDVNGRPVANSAGIFYSPPPTFEDGLEVLTITNYSITYDDAPHRTARKKKNAEAFLNRPAGTCLLDDISVTQQEFQLPDGSFYDYWQKVYTIVVNPEGWDLVLIDQGDEELEEELSNPIPATLGGDQQSEAEAVEHIAAPKVVKTDKAGQPQAGPIGLNGKGKALGPGESPVELLFARVKPVSFSNLGILTNFPAGGPRPAVTP
jgi:hypothetical protein